MRLVALLFLAALAQDPKAKKPEPRPKPPDEVSASKVEAAVQAGLKWLAAHQQADGSWTSKAEGAACGSDPKVRKACPDEEVGGLPAEAVTGLALAAFVGAGVLPDSTQELGSVKAGEVVTKAAAFLRSVQKETGRFDSGQLPMLMHSMAAWGFLRAYGASKTPEWKEPAEKAVMALLDGQNPGAGWRYSPKSGDNDSWVTCWALYALRAGEQAGIEVKAAPYQDALAWIHNVTLDTGAVGFTHKGTGKVFTPGKNERYADHPLYTAMALTAKMALGIKPKDPLAQAQAALIMKDLPAWGEQQLQADHFHWFHAAMALRAWDGESGPDWKYWRRWLLATLVPGQTAGPDDCRLGSWAPTDKWGWEGGRPYSTALAVLALEVAQGRKQILFEPRKPAVEPKPKK